MSLSNAAAAAVAASSSPSLSKPSLDPLRASLGSTTATYESDSGDDEEEAALPYYEEPDWIPVMPKSGKQRSPNQIRNELQRYIDKTPGVTQTSLARDVLDVSGNSMSKFMSEFIRVMPVRLYVCFVLTVVLQLVFAIGISAVAFFRFPLLPFLVERSAHLFLCGISYLHFFLFRSQALQGMHTRFLGLSHHDDYHTFFDLQFYLM